MRVLLILLVLSSPAMAGVHFQPVAQDSPRSTPSVGGSSLSGGSCSTTTTSVVGAAAGDRWLTVPSTYPGDWAWRFSYTSAAGTVTTKVCVARVMTPTASTYTIKKAD